MAASRRVAPILVGAALSIAVPFVAHYEGLRTDPYLDAVGVLTVCYGHTKGVKPGNSYTKEQCGEVLVADMQEHALEYQRCAPRFEVLPPEQQAALASWVYNVGAGAACKSTLTKKMQAGSPFCDELTRWTYAGGRQLQGLVRRREAERELCESAL